MGHADSLVRTGPGIRPLLNATDREIKLRELRFLNGRRLGAEAVRLLPDVGAEEALRLHLAIDLSDIKSPDAITTISPHFIMGAFAGAVAQERLHKGRDTR